MQWQVDQSVNRKLPPLPLPSSCMAAALIGNNGICCWLPTAAETGNCSSSSAPSSRTGQGEFLLFLSSEHNTALLDSAPTATGKAGRGKDTAAILGAQRSQPAALMGGYLSKKIKTKPSALMGGYLLKTKHQTKTKKQQGKWEIILPCLDSELALQ